MGQGGGRVEGKGGWGGGKSFYQRQMGQIELSVF